MSATGMMVSRSSVSGGGGSGRRWCPTPEQVMLLEGMYRAGLKTPTSTQIQQITSRLSLYGKIQGKNVFYWFQNHKARDRQKLRKKLMAAMYDQHHRFYPSYHHHHHPYPLLQGGVVIEDTSSSFCKNRVMNKWNTKCDCLPLMMMESTSPYCTRVPPKTLQLFPTTTTRDDLNPN